MNKLIIDMENRLLMGACKGKKGFQQQMLELRELLK